MPTIKLGDELEKLRKALGGQSTDIASIVASISDIETDDSHVKSIGSFFYSTWKEIAVAHKGDPQGQPSSIALSSIKTAAQVAATSSTTPRHLCTALDYLYLWAEVGQYLNEHQLGPLRYTEILGEEYHLLALEDRLCTCRSSLSTEYGFLMLQGLLRGLSDRTSAASLFQRAVSDNASFSRSQLLDTFLGTYLSDSDVNGNAEEIAARRAELRESFEVINGELPAQPGSVVFLFSCDPSFFSVFFPYWASASMYLRGQGIHLHFVLAGSSADVSTALDHGLDLATSMARLRGLSPAVLSECFSFSRIGMPADVGELRTFYACARFLVARDLVSSTPARILIVDIDTEVHSDPQLALRELESIAPNQMPVVAVRGLLALIPAYRLPAYRVVLPDREIVSDVLLDIENYIYTALTRAPSWLLDQNALDYAAGRRAAKYGCASLVEVNGHLSPFQQRPIGQMYKLMQASQ